MTAKDSKAYMYVVECATAHLYRLHQLSKRRLKTHNSGKGAKYTESLLYSEAFASKPEAMSAEALFKKKPREKLAYQRTHGKINCVSFLISLIWFLLICLTSFLIYLRWEFLNLTSKFAIKPLPLFAFSASSILLL